MSFQVSTLPTPFENESPIEIGVCKILDTSSIKFDALPCGLSVSLRWAFLFDAIPPFLAELSQNAEHAMECKLADA